MLLNIPDNECDHEAEFHDDSFDHAFGIEVSRYWLCKHCGIEMDVDERFEEPDER